MFVCWANDSLKLEESEEGSKFSRQISYSGWTPCYLCLKKVNNRDWLPGDHRRQCAYANKQELLNFPTPYGGVLDCSKCYERMKLWPAKGAIFFCDVCEDEQESNGENRLSCFLCDYDICVGCAKKGIANREQVRHLRDEVIEFAKSSGLEELYNYDNLIPPDLYITTTKKDDLIKKLLEDHEESLKSNEKPKREKTKFSEQFLSNDSDSNTDVNEAMRMANSILKNMNQTSPLGLPHPVSFFTTNKDFKTTGNNSFSNKDFKTTGHTTFSNTNSQTPFSNQNVNIPFFLTTPFSENTTSNRSTTQSTVTRNITITIDPEYSSSSQSVHLPCTSRTSSNSPPTYNEATNYP